MNPSVDNEVISGDPLVAAPSSQDLFELEASGDRDEAAEAALAESLRLARAM